MRRYLTFLIAGTFFSTVEEFLTIVVLKHDVGSYLFTLIVLFPAFLTFVFVSCRLIDRVLLNSPFRDAAHFLIYAGIGLLIEWFLIGLALWSNPDANPLLMFLFQLGMFSFWATVAFAPRLFIRSDDISAKARRSILRFYIPYFLFVYVVALTVPERAKFAAIITLIIIGYWGVAVALVRYLRQSLPSLTHGTTQLTSTPVVSTETKRRLEILFREEDQTEAARLLAEECGNNLPCLENLDEQGLERFQFAALKLSRGDLARLRNAIELAKTDWRDLLMDAGFGHDIRAHERWIPTRS